MPISGVNLTPRPTAVYASDPALPRRPQDSLPSCLLGFERTRLALASSYQLSYRTPHRAPVEGQTRPAFGAWAALPVPIRGLGPSVTCWFRLCVRGMRWPLPFLRPAAFPPRSPSSARRLTLFEASSVLCSRPTPSTFRSGFGSSPSRTNPGPPWRLRAAGGLPGSDTILDGSNWSQTPVEQRSLAERSRTCCLRRFAAPRPPR